MGGVGGSKVGDATTPNGAFRIHHSEIRLIFSVQTETRISSSKPMKTLRTLFVAVGFLIAVAITPAHASSELVLKVEGLPGDSQVAGHVNEIDVLSISFGASQTGIREAGGKASPRRSSLSTFSIQKKADKASPKLFLACATGQYIPTAVLTFRDIEAGTAPHEYLTITLSDVFISSYQVSDSSGGDLAYESVSISFSKIEYKYVGRQPNGQPLPPVVVTFDVVKNKELTAAPQ
jgi:type VI secretion system secreted protein Hcp